VSITIKDIAQIAKVSPSTVSRALHDHPRISEETRNKIQELARELGYIPSQIARNLVTKKSATIGVVIPEFSDPFYMGILAGIEDIAIANKFDLIVGSFERDLQRKRKLFENFEEKWLAGLVIAGTLVDDAYLAHNRRALPAVLINKPNYPYAVDIDQERGSHQAISHLFELGHRRIAYIGLGIGSESENRRFEGYCKALTDNDLIYDPELLVNGNGRIAGGVIATKKLFSQPNPPTAIFCYNDRTAIGAIHALHQSGLRVPTDVSIVGFDDLDIASYVNPPLTTVRQPNVELGRLAATMLFDRINNEPVRPQKLKPQLIIRQSTGRCDQSAQQRISSAINTFQLFFK
jgi:DNA-binding LacI/PurR family transcriptional regulator